MLYLKSLVIDRFKSFRHAELLFNNGFTCIVGANGSGKSTTFDALLFGLGEKSLKRLRVSSFEGLLTASPKSKKGLRKAYVKMVFGGDENIEVARYLRSDGKSGYRVNGRHMKKHEVMEMLSKHGMSSDDTNTMMQGEIHRVIAFNPRERRELIDIASGIKDFDIKKEESLKELEKVDQRISEAMVSLNERRSFLNELGKEKESAESYLEMNKRLKALRYSLLSMRKDELQLAYDESTRKMALADQRKNEFKRRHDELSKNIEQLGAARQALISEMNESTVSSGSRSKKLELYAAESASLNSEISNKEALIVQWAADAAALEAEKKGIEEKIAANGAEIGLLKAEEQEFAKVVAELDYLTLGEKKADEIRNINQKIVELSSRLMNEQELSSKSHADASAIIEKKGFYEKQAMELSSTKEALVKDISVCSNREAEITQRLKSSEQDVKKIDANVKAATASIEDMDEKLIGLREQRSFARPKNSAIESGLDSAFGKEHGFYGRAALLCSYDVEYATALEVAAGPRLDYFVVEDIDAANLMIEHMKKNRLGRATFIPINGVRAASSSAERDKGHVADLVKFDKKFAKVFEYIFEDTFLVKGVDEVKKKGLGKHRYVTLEGELFERSGVMTGGTGFGKMSVRTIDMNIDKLLSEKKAAKDSLDALTGSLFELRKERSLLENELKSVKSTSSKLSSEIAITEKKISDCRLKIEEMVAGLGANEKDAAASEKQRLDTAMEVESLKAKLAVVEKGRGRDAARAEEIKRLNDAREGLNKSRVRIAEIGTENQLTGDRINRISLSQKKLKDDYEKSMKAIKDLKLKLEVVNGSRKKVEDEIKSSSNVATKAYEKLKEIEEDLSSLGMDSGKAAAELSGAERELNELNLSRSQTGTRLDDIKAEFSLYENDIEVIKGKHDEMEGEANLISAKIKDLGNVNLKAPEIYVAKKAEVDEANGKVSVLQSEKDAILDMIKEIESKKLQIFMNTFNEVNKNFTKLHKSIFEANDAELRLNDMSDPLNSGLDMVVMQGKNSWTLNQLSGGEKAFAVLALLFAIHRYRPSRIYIFDEVDSALDKNNSKILSKLIKNMSRDAQFVVVSHNDSLVVDADVAVGVVKEGNESVVVGVEMAEVAKAKQVVG